MAAGARSKIVGAAVGFMAVVGVIAVDPVGAAPVCPQTTSGSTVTVTCGYTGAVQSWTVPAGVSDETFTVLGGSGQSAAASAGGTGGGAQATFSLPAGTTVNVTAGGAGSAAQRGSFGGGGRGGPGNARNVLPGGSGGGGSFVTTLAGADLVVAGGGGGAAAGFCGVGGANGGAGGGSIGGDGALGAFPAPCAPGLGGGSGTPPGGGQAGQGGNAGTGPDAQGIGHGGAGPDLGSAGLLPATAPGGGGGGYFGGGSGGVSPLNPVESGGGGGGGSGFLATTNPAFVSGSFPTKTNSGNGSVVITYTVSTAPSPTVLRATPALATVGPGLTVYLFNLFATLTTRGAPVAGRLITFSAAGTPVCQAVTNASGTATCWAVAVPSGLIAVIAHLGYEASFAGGPVYAASSAHAPVLLIGGVPIR